MKLNFDFVTFYVTSWLNYSLKFNIVSCGKIMHQINVILCNIHEISILKLRAIILAPEYLHSTNACEMQLNSSMDVQTKKYTNEWKDDEKNIERKEFIIRNLSDHKIWILVLSSHCLVMLQLRRYCWCGWCKKKQHKFVNDCNLFLYIFCNECSI